MHPLQPLQSHHPSFISGRVTARAHLAQDTRQPAASALFVNRLCRTRGFPQKPRQHRQMWSCKSGLWQKWLCCMWQACPFLNSHNSQLTLIQTPLVFPLNGWYVGCLWVLKSMQWKVWLSSESLKKKKSQKLWFFLAVECMKLNSHPIFWKKGRDRGQASNSHTHSSFFLHLTHLAGKDLLPKFQTCSFQKRQKLLSSWVLVSVLVRTRGFYAFLRWNYSNFQNDCLPLYKYYRTKDQDKETIYNILAKIVSLLHFLITQCYHISPLIFFFLNFPHF